MIPAHGIYMDTATIYMGTATVSKVSVGNILVIGEFSLVPLDRFPRPL